MTVNWMPKFLLHRAKVWFGAALCKVLLLVATLRNRRSRRILALPDKPVPQSALYKVAHRLGYRFVTDEKEQIGPDGAKAIADALKVRVLCGRLIVSVHLTVVRGANSACAVL